MAETTIVGRVGQDPELTTPETGAARVRFSIAENERRRQPDGSWVDGTTTWWDVVAFGPLARNTAQVVRKGQLLVVQGQVALRDYQTRDGQTRRSANITARAIGQNLVVPLPAPAPARLAEAQQPAAEGQPEAVADGWAAADDARDPEWATIV